jgi:hypothetical protein
VLIGRSLLRFADWIGAMSFLLEQFPCGARRQHFKRLICAHQSMCLPANYMYFALILNDLLSEFLFNPGNGG